MPFLGSLSPELVWGLFTRGLGVVFLISFASLAGQIVRCAGPQGGVPIGPRLAKIAEDFPTWRRFFYFPTLLWLNQLATRCCARCRWSARGRARS